MGCNLFFFFGFPEYMLAIILRYSIRSSVTCSRCISPLSIAFRACGRIIVLSPGLRNVHVCVSNLCERRTHSIVKSTLMAK